MDRFLSLLQFSDGLFPAGAYAHSFGLEYYVQSERVKDANGVRDFIRANLTGSLATADTIAMLAALRSVGRVDALSLLLFLDETVDAMKPIEELRNASRQMGRQTIRVAASLTDSALLRSFFAATESDATPGHHPVCFGAIAGILGWSPGDAVTAYLYSASAAMTGAALRLLPLGQTAGQRILWEIRALIERLAREAVTKDLNEMSSFVPGVEIASMRHSRLDARLFRS